MRAAEAAFYPLPLLKAILQGISDTKLANQSATAITEEEYGTSRLLTVSPVVVASDAPVTKVEHADIGTKGADNINPDSLSPGKLPVQGGGFVKKYTMRPTILSQYTWMSTHANHYLMNLPRLPQATNYIISMIAFGN